MVNPVDDMTDNKDDGILTAYLDGELEPAERAALERRLLAEPALKARLDQLSRGGRPFGPAYDALLATAPVARMQAMLADLAVKHAHSGRQAARFRSQRLAALAAALVIFVVGAAAGYIVPLVTAKPPPAPGWRQVVAEYQVLTTTDTLAAIPENADVVAGELSAAGSKLAMALTPEKLALPNVALKRAQLFEFRGKPLVQVAYLSQDNGPIAFCIIANGRPDEGFAFEQREGSNIVFWTKGGRGYLIMGKAPRQALEAFAGDLAGRIS